MISDWSALLSRDKGNFPSKKQSCIYSTIRHLLAFPSILGYGLTEEVLRNHLHYLRAFNSLVKSVCLLSCFYIQKILSLEEMDATIGQRKLIPRGAMPKALAQQKLSSFALSGGKAVTASIQCDSGFGDDEELRFQSIECNDKEIRSVEERTQNLTIADPDTNTRHPSLGTDEQGLSRNEELFLNYAQSNDVRYLFAQEHVRRLLFLQDDDGDT